jgi:hypothetical protein
MLFVANCDIDGLCQHGQILGIIEMAAIISEAGTAEAVVCRTQLDAEIWAGIILEGVEK